MKMLQVEPKGKPQHAEHLAVWVNAQYCFKNTSYTYIIAIFRYESVSVSLVSLWFWFLIPPWSEENTIFTVLGIYPGVVSIGCKL